MEKSLDRKLALLAKDPAADCFILADAKDPDMARGVASAGRNRDGSLRPISALREQIREIVREELVDIMLMSASTSEILTIEERLFAASPVTAAARGNDTTDLFLAPGGRYPSEASRPFASTTVDHIMAGKYPASEADRKKGADLALYSITFNNDLERDLASLEAYKAFRLEAEAKGLRHFLEVFTPNVPASVHGLAPEQIAPFMNDHIVRLLGGVPKSSRPLFLKIPYLGPRAVEDLVTFDPSIIVGVLGGSAGTTHDAFHLLADAKAHGARVALFGRKIVAAEHQVSFVVHLRHVAEGRMSAKEAVKAYHADLAKRGIAANRPLEKDLELTETTFAYAG